MIPPIDPGECLIAVAGLHEIVTGNMPLVGVEMMRKCRNLPREIEREAKRAIAGELDERVTIPRPVTYDQALERFTRPISQDEIASLVKRFTPESHDVFPAFAGALQKTYAHLAEELPVSTYETQVGPKHLPPPSDKLFEWYARYWIACDPLVTFRLIQTGALMAIQVATLMEDFPTMLEAFKSATIDAIAARGARDKSFINLPYRTDRGVSVLVGKRIMPYGGAIKSEPAQAPIAAASVPVSAKLPKTMQTQGQAAEQL